MNDALARELTAAGIRGRLRARILAEAEDHLRSDPESATRFGEPREIANAFAAELGTQAARSAAIRAFLALGLAGLVYGVAYVGALVTSNPSADSAAASLALAIMVVAPQVSFVAGSLALTRAIRLRRPAMLPSAELTTINRRTAVALLAGLATIAALVAYALLLRHQLPTWLVAFTTVAGSVSALLVALTIIPLVAAMRFQPRIGGTAGDIFDDIPLPPMTPRRLATLVAIGAGVIVWLQAALQGDPLDGVAIGMFEAVACASGYATLGRYLRIRQ